MKLTKLIIPAILLSACAVAQSVDPTLAHTGPEATQSAAKSTTAFGLDLYHGILADDTIPEDAKQNLFISPASLSTAFGLLYPGARGDTAAELKQVLHIERPVDKYTAAMGQLVQSLEIDQPNERVSINNSLWTDKLTVLEQPYLDLMESAYKAEDNRVDYRNDPDGARATINDWVENKTEGLIKGLLTKPNVSVGTRTILVNTIYLKADWAKQFTKEATRDDDFTLTTGEKIQTKMMRQVENFRHMTSKDFAAVELPYVRGNMSMVLLRPNSRSGLPALEERLLSDPSALESTLAELSESEVQKVDLKVPKLKVEQRYELKKPLNALGMQLSFSNNASFEGIADPKKQPDASGIKVSDVIHQTFLEVDEKGTEAAAATAIAVTVITSVRQGPPPPPPIPFFADHPFLLVLKDNRTGTILFLGRITDPR